MKISKVSLYVREHSTRKHKPANKRLYEPGTIFVLRYRSSCETLGEVSHADAERARLNRSIQLLGGWKPELKPKPAPAALMFENAMDTYLSEIEAGRKKKTHQHTRGRCATAASAWATRLSRTSDAAICSSSHRSCARKRTRAHSPRLTNLKAR